MSITLRRGKQTVKVELRTRTTLTLRLIDIRFKERKWNLKYGDADPSKIKIIDIDTAKISWGDNSPQLFTNKTLTEVGGIRLGRVLMNLFL
jgi:hypothetical protein